MSERRNRPEWLANFRGQPDRAAALARYARLAPHYEDTTTRIREVRERALDLLMLQPGETAFDIACGAGAILRGLSWRVGPRGRVETFRSPTSADAAILCYTHDVLQSPQALANLFAQLRPGARVSVAGLCLLPAWGMPVNAWVLWGARRYLTTWRGLRAPWEPLLDWCPDLRLVERYHWGTGYLAVGTVRSR